jgi:F-type H+-transporting ATPase subunit a
MADPVLHIKDSYYFEVPKVLYPYDLKHAWQFPDVWVSLDPEFQEWEFERLYQKLSVVDAGLPTKEDAKHEWQRWAHADHKNFAKPFDVFLEEKYESHLAKFNQWKSDQVQAAARKDESEVENAKRLEFGDYLAHVKSAGSEDAGYLEFLQWRHGHKTTFVEAKNYAGDQQAIREWKESVRKEDVADWSKDTIAAYNAHLSGKILIPQPFATLRNLYEKEGHWYEGIAISKFLIIEIVVGLILVVIFQQLSQRISAGRPPKGKLWNLLETFLVFIRDQIAKPVFGGHDHGHDDEHASVEHGHEHQGHGHAAASHAHAAHEHHADPTTRFVPLLWTIFFFVLGCNLMGMVPWAGAPTAAWAVTFALACVTFFTVIVSGMMQFGVGGFFLNQIPGMDLPWYMAIVIKPMILAIELLGLVIKHLVLSVRLLANMVAGHLVILGVMGLAFGAQAALTFTAPDTPGWQWWFTATIAVVGAAAFNVLELFVAFLQAYIFTFLSALFIGAAIHKH